METNALTGQVSQNVQEYTELGDGLNYSSNGQWVDAQDLIELTPAGAEAVHGQMTAKFSPDITAVGAITLTTASGQVFQFRPLGLYYADTASGQVAQIAKVQPSQGLLYPPNVIVFSNVFSEVKADLMLVWAKNGFEPSLVIKQSPPAPEVYGLSSSSTRLQMWTAFDQCPNPIEQRSFQLRSGLVDQILIFADCWFPVGAAFALGPAPLPTAGQTAAVRLTDPSATNVISTAKSLVTIAGQKVLIEEARYTDLLPAFKGLAQVSRPTLSHRAVELAERKQVLPPPSAAGLRPAPFRLAAAPYRVNGLVIDPVIPLSGSASSQTFTSGSTYYIANSFTVGPGPATFQSGSVIKYGPGAYLFLNECSVSFPSSGSSVVFTSKDDNGYGLKVDGSTSTPGYAANPALWVYNRLTRTTIQNARFSWAQRAIQYTEETGAGLQPNLNSSSFEDSNVGVYVDIANDTLYVSGDKYCNVTTPISIVAGYVYGSMTADCGTPTFVSRVDASELSGNEGEPSIAVNPTDPSKLFAVANSNNGHNLPLWAARSAYGGLSWTLVTSLPQTAYSDPHCAFDAYGNLFVAYLGPNSEIEVSMSTDNGQTFSVVRTFSNYGLPDYPALATGPDGSGNQAVWVAGNNYNGTVTYMWVSGARVSGSTVGSWVDNTITAEANYNWAQLAVGPSGEVAFAFAASTKTAQPGTPIYVSVNTGGLNGTFPTATTVHTSNMSTPTPAHHPPAQPDRGFWAKPAALAWDCTGGAYHDRLYLAYVDLPDTTQNDHYNVYLTCSTNQGRNWYAGNSGNPLNNDSTSNSHFLPWMAVDQTSGKIAVSWYDCRNDPNNSNTQFYAAVSSNGGTNFPSNYMLEAQNYHSSAPGTSGYDYFDYTGLAYYGGYFYSAWADNSNSTGNNPDGTSKLDIYVVKFSY